MTKPIPPLPDGQVRLRLKHPYHVDMFSPDERGVWPLEAYLVTFTFDQMVDGYHQHETEFNTTIKGDPEIRYHYQMEDILEIEVIKNSERYTELLKEYRRLHLHNWVEQEQQVSLLGWTDPRVIKVCEVAKTGEEGCGAMMIDGVISGA